MWVGGRKEGRRTDGRSWGLGICLLRFNPVQYICTQAGTCTINYYQNCRNCCARFRRCRRLDGGNKLRAHSLSGRASLTLSLTSDWTYDKLTEASLCQHSTAPPPDLLLVDARRLMTTSILPQSFVDLSQSPFPFLSFWPRSTTPVLKLRHAHDALPAHNICIMIRFRISSLLSPLSSLVCRLPSAES